MLSGFAANSSTKYVKGRTGGGGKKMFTSTRHKEGFCTLSAVTGETRPRKRRREEAKEHR